jgi:hypothetical protein
VSRTLLRGSRILQYLTGPEVASLNVFFLHARIAQPPRMDDEQQQRTNPKPSLFSLSLRKQQCQRFRMPFWP